MKIIRLLSIILALFFSTLSISYGQCTTCTDVSNIISYNGNGNFSATNAQAYFWEVCEGNAIINGTNTNQNVNVTCTNTGEFKIKVTRFINGNCITSCEVYNCRNNIITIDNVLCNYFLGILDEYIDGTQSGVNYVYLQAGGNFPVGTTYSWWITRQNGSTEFYDFSPQNPRLIAASINNRITKAKVTATYGNCTKTITKRFKCAIPNTDINGDLFPECRFIRGGFGLLETNGKIKVFPNPTKSKITFRGEDLHTQKITITDLMGRVLIEKMDLTGEINLDQEKSGIYFYIITDEKGNRQKGKIVKE